MRNVSEKSVVRIGAYGILIQDGALLLTLCKSGPFQGLLSLPGGGMEEGETIEETLRRELFEEVSICFETCTYIDLFTTSAFYEKEGVLLSYNFVGHIYRISEWKVDETKVAEDEFFWVDPHTIDQVRLAPFAKSAIASLSFS